MIIPIERIEREATEAAKRYSDINDACPYPFHSDAAHTFKAFFDEARKDALPTVPGLKGAYTRVWSKR